MEKYLPMGSIVLLKDGTKRIMIYGRKQLSIDTGEEFDYATFCIVQTISRPDPKSS